MRPDTRIGASALVLSMALAIAAPQAQAMDWQAPTLDPEMAQQLPWDKVKVRIDYEIPQLSGGWGVDLINADWCEAKDGVADTYYRYVHAVGPPSLSAENVCIPGTMSDTEFVRRGRTGSGSYSYSPPGEFRLGTHIFRFVFQMGSRHGNPHTHVLFEAVNVKCKWVPDKPPHGQKRECWVE